MSQVMRQWVMIIFYTLYRFLNSFFNDTAREEHSFVSVLLFEKIKNFNVETAVVHDCSPLPLNSLVNSRIFIFCKLYYKRRKRYEVTHSKGRLSNILNLYFLWPKNIKSMQMATINSVQFSRYKSSWQFCIRMKMRIYVFSGIILLINNLRCQTCFDFILSLSLNLYLFKGLMLFSSNKVSQNSK